MLKLNVGNLDRILRVLAGAVLIALAASGFIGIWGYVGCLLVLTGLGAFCPLYTVLGIRTTAR